MQIGSSAVSAAYYGSQTVTAVYLGSSLAWSSAAFSWAATGIVDAVTVSWTGSNTFTATGIAEAVTVSWS